MKSFIFPVAHLMWIFGVFYRFKTPIKYYRVMASFVPLLIWSFWCVCMAWYYRYRVFPIVPGLNVMLTVVGRRLQGTCWNALIFFWRDISEPYMPLRLVVSMGGSKTRMEFSAAKNPSPKLAGLFLFHLL